MLRRGKEKEINAILDSGFDNVKYYDTDLFHAFYDATLNGAKVEVRINEKEMEWRYFGVKNIEDVEWFGLNINDSEIENEDAESSNNETTNSEDNTENNVLEDDGQLSFGLEELQTV